MGGSKTSEALGLSKVFLMSFKVHMTKLISTDNFPLHTDPFLKARLLLVNFHGLRK